MNKIYYYYIMPIIDNPLLYEKAKNIANEAYKKNSAYKSGFIVKMYKELGGKYKDDNKEKKLNRWFLEEWKDIGNKNYPVYRPTIKVNKNTPLLVSEINKDDLIKKINIKQKIKGDKNLKPFLKK